MNKDIKTILEQLFGERGRLVTEAYGDSLWFPEFDIECFQKDYEEWKQANGINKKEPVRPQKPVMTQRMSTDRINMTPVEKADAELKRRGIENPKIILKNTQEPPNYVSDKSLQDKLDEYSIINWLRKQLKKRMLDPRHSKVVFIILTKKANKNPWFVERLTEINKYEKLLDPRCSWIPEDIIEQKLYDILHDKEFHKELDDLEEMCDLSRMQRNYFLEQIKTIYDECLKVIPAYDKMRKQIRMEYEKKKKEYEDYYELYYKVDKKQDEYDKLRKSLIKKYRAEDVPEYGTEDNEEKYRDDMEKYCQDMKDYNDDMRLYGKRNYSISEYIIMRYVYPMMDGESSVVLKNGQTYEFPDFIRGKKIDEMIFKKENIISFSVPYKEFLKRNGFAREERNSRDGIRSTDSDWTYRKFITAWVLKHYTTIYDDVNFE